MGTVLLRLAAAAALMSLASAPVLASDRSAGEQAKIDVLLERIRGSSAVFIRNGTEYDGKKAAAHLKTKLFFAGSRVRTARDFVLGVASRSEESGQPYRLRLADGRTRPLGDWLLENLADLEKPPPTPSPTRLPGRPP